MKNGNEVKFLLDTGSNKNYITPKLIRQPIPNKPFVANSVGGQVKITHHANIDIFGHNIGKLKFHILPNLTTFEAIIGNDTLKQLNAVIFTKENYFTLLNKYRYSIKQLNITSIAHTLLRLTHLSSEDSNELKKLCYSCPTLFSDPDKRLTFVTNIKAEIRTKSDRPIYSKTYPYPMPLKNEIDKQIKELLKDGIIRPSKSPYNSPVWIVPKKQDASGSQKYRMVIDYRKLNEDTVPDKYPIPDVTTILSNLGANKYFSTIDLKSGFHQIALNDADIEKTAFSIANGKFEFTRLPFGLRNAPAIFQRTLDDVLREHIGVRCYVYIDDIIIFSKSKEQHFNDLKIIFDTLEKANLKVQFAKCEFIKEETEFLGIIVGQNGIRTTPKKVEAIKNFPRPKNIHDLRSFLGMAGHYRRFVKAYAQIAKPLTEILRGELGRISKHMSKKTPINLSAQQIEAFKQLKMCLVSEDVMLHYPDFNKAFELTTDASDYALGAVLAQDGRPISFLSRTLSRAEENYATNEKEMLAIIDALQSLRCFLYGSKKIKIFTDHQPLTFALSNKNTNAKMKRWKAQLEEYNHELIYKPGSTNVVADLLSRPPITSVNSLTPTVHSSDSSSENLIPSVETPINVFKNQILISEDSTPSYKFDIIFPMYHRHTVTVGDTAEASLVAILKNYLNPAVINAIRTSEQIMLRIQTIYTHHFANYKIRFTHQMVEDVTDTEEQNKIIIETHNRAHRNEKENRLQILEKYFFPAMARKIKNITKICRICKESKYDRHPNKTKLGSTPLPEYSGHTIHIDIFSTDKHQILTSIDKFSKLAVTKNIDGKSMENIRKPLREIILYFGVPKNIVFDNEKAFSSQPIKFMLENEFNINTFIAPPYKSEINGQIERFHSTIAEIMRCLKQEYPDKNFDELLECSVNEYNHTIHSVTEKRPVDLFFGRPTSSDPDSREQIRAANCEKLKRKQQQDLQYHNKNKSEIINYEQGDKIYVRQNKRLGTKLSKRYKEEIVKENKNSTVTTESGKVVHKDRIKNR